MVKTKCVMLALTLSIFMWILQIMPNTILAEEMMTISASYTFGMDSPIGNTIGENVLDFSGDNKYDSQNQVDSLSEDGVVINYSSYNSDGYTLPERREITDTDGITKVGATPDNGIRDYRRMLVRLSNSFYDKRINGPLQDTNQLSDVEKTNVIVDIEYLDNDLLADKFVIVYNQHKGTSIAEEWSNRLEGSNNDGKWKTARFHLNDAVLLGRFQVDEHSTKTSGDFMISYFSNGEGGRGAEGTPIFIHKIIVSRDVPIPEPEPEPEPEPLKGLSSTVPTFDKKRLEPNDIVSCFSKISNSDTSEGTAYLIVALYDGENSLKKVEINSLVIEGEEKDIPINTEISLPDNVENYTLLAYVWSGSLEPLRNKIEFEEDNTPEPEVLSYFGMSSSGEWSWDNHEEEYIDPPFKRYGRIYKELRDAGISFFRIWTEWESDFRPGEPFYSSTAFNNSDAYVQRAATHGIEITGILGYLPGWASASYNGTGNWSSYNRMFPMSQDGKEAYKAYVRASLERYKDTVKYWEVYNEFNSYGHFSKNSGPKDYAEMTIEAYKIAQSINEENKDVVGWKDIEIGISCASMDINFFSQVIRGGEGWDGAKDHFDFIAVHPYELLSSVLLGREAGYLSMNKSLTTMLIDCGYTEQEADEIGFWITEVGIVSDREANEEKDQDQAEALVKMYTIPLAIGFERVCWFEGRGPDYGTGEDFGILRQNWERRPSFHALQTMTGLLGATPQNLGWLNPSEADPKVVNPDYEFKSYCFVFQGETEPIMVVWSVDQEGRLDFGKDVTITTMYGETSVSDTLVVNKTPVFVSNLPEEWVEAAKENKGRAFDWVDFSEKERVECILGLVNHEDGLYLLDNKGDGVTTAVLDGGADHVRKNEGNYMYFAVDPGYVGPSDRKLEIAVTGRGEGFNFEYESTTGHKGMGSWTSLDRDSYVRRTFVIEDAAFVYIWDWNFRLTFDRKTNYISRVEVRLIED